MEVDDLMSSASPIPARFKCTNLQFCGVMTTANFIGEKFLVEGRMRKLSRSISCEPGFKPRSNHWGVALNPAQLHKIPGKTQGHAP